MTTEVPSGRMKTICLGIRFNRLAPGDESPGYCHRCPLMGHQHRFKLALMPLEGEGWVGGIRNYCVCISNNLIRLFCIVVTHEEDVL